MVRFVVRDVVGTRAQAGAQFDAERWRTQVGDHQLRGDRPMKQVSLFDALRTIQASGRPLQSIVFSLIDDGFHAGTLLPEYRDASGRDIWTLYTTEATGTFTNSTQHSSGAATVKR